MITKNKLWHRCTWMALCIVSLWMVMPASGTAQVLAQEESGYWELISVDVEERPPQDGVHTVTYNISRGSGTYRDEVEGESFQASMTWTEPGQRYAGGQSIDLTISVEIDEYVWDDDEPGYINQGLNYMAAGISARIDEPDIGYSGATGSSISLIDLQGEYYAEVRTDYGKIVLGSETLQVSAQFPPGGSDGDKKSIYVNCTAGMARYNYQWVKKDSEALVPPITTDPEDFQPESESGPLTTAPKPALGGSIWRTIVTVGIAIAGTLSAIAGELANKAAQAAASGKDEQPTEETVYVLNPSQKMFNLEVNKPVTLKVNGYKVTREGYQIEKEAVITVSLPPNLAECFSLQTTGSNGQISCTITLLNIPSASTAALQVEGVFPHGKADTQIELVFKTVFAISPVNSPNITYYEKEKRWQVPDLVAFFRKPGQDTPVKVGFYYGFMDPPLTFEPDILEVKEGYSSDGGLTYDFKLDIKDGIDLETYFGEDLTDDNGKVTVNIVVKDESGKEYPAKTELQVHPQLKMVAYAYDLDIGKSGRPETPYKGLELKDMQFVADGIDVLPLVFFFVRTDKELLEGDEYLSAVDLVDVQSVKFTAGKFPDPEVNAEDSGEGLFAYKVRSNGAILYAREEPTHYALQVEPRMKAGAPANIGLAGMSHEIPVSPQFLKFHFWVVPGQYRDTSEAFAYVQLYPSKMGVPNMPLSLEVENPSDRNRGFLELVNGDREQTTREEDYAKSEAYVPLAKGSACWALRYSNMNWDNLSSCIFKITCTGPESDTGPIWQTSRTINVGQNIHTLLSDFLDSADSLKLNNPYWKDSLCPYHLRGPVWNLICRADSSKPYVCHWLRERIMGWLTDRSLYGEGGGVEKIESMMDMNGIEYQYCSFTPFHVWANLFLSGTDQIKAAKALDPWWEQRWVDPSLKNHENLRTVYSELSWKLSQRGLGLRAVAEIAAGVLFFAGIVSTISMIAPFLVPLTVPSAVAVITTTYIVAAPANAIILYGGTVDYDNYHVDGRKRLFQPAWFMNFIENLSNSSD